MKEFNYTQVTDAIMNSYFNNIYILDLAAMEIVEYSNNLPDMDSKCSYEDWLCQMVNELIYTEIQSFLTQMSVSDIIAALNKGIRYKVSYAMKSHGRLKYYHMTASYCDQDRDSVLITKQEVTSYMERQTVNVSNLQKESERFRFMIQNMCENFGEIDPVTGEAWMTTLHNWEVEKTNIKDQITWFAENLIIPEQKEEYESAFELDNLVDSLRKNNGFYAPVFGAQYPDGIHYLLINTALLSNPQHFGKEYIFSFAQDITQQKKQEEQNKHLVNISQELLELSQKDALTTLLNHAAGEKQISEAIASMEDGCHGTLILLDIDYFKKINDTYGHAVGDDVLRYLGQTIRGIFRAHDVLCRWGGDEFLLYLPTAYSNEIKTLLHILQKKMHAYMHRSSSLPITLSIGAAVSTSGDTLKLLFERADSLLYQVKKMGRNAYNIQ